MGKMKSFLLLGLVVSTVTAARNPIESDVDTEAMRIENRQKLRGKRACIIGTDGKQCCCLNNDCPCLKGFKLYEREDADKETDKVDSQLKLREKRACWRGIDGKQCCCLNNNCPCLKDLDNGENGDKESDKVESPLKKLKKLREKRAFTKGV